MDIDIGIAINTCSYLDPVASLGCFHKLGGPLKAVLGSLKEGLPLGAGVFNYGSFREMI